MKKLVECTTTGSIAGYNKPLDAGNPIKRVETKRCAACEKLQGSRVICGICGRKQ